MVQIPEEENKKRKSRISSQTPPTLILKGFGRKREPHTKEYLTARVAKMFKTAEPDKQMQYNQNENEPFKFTESIVKFSEACEEVHERNLGEGGSIVYKINRKIKRTNTNKVLHSTCK